MNETEDYGKAKESWLRQQLRLPNGIPSHDTFNRFFSALDPEAFEEAFMSWIRAISCLTEGEVVSIDGKTLRGSRGSGGKHAIHMVSALANINQLCLGQVKVDKKRYPAVIGSVGIERLYRSDRCDGLSAGK